MKNFDTFSINKISLMPYINVYRSILPDPEKCVNIIKESEDLEKIGPYISEWERWYDFGFKARLEPTKEEKHWITLNSEHLGMLNEKEQHIFDSQDFLYNQIDGLINYVLKDYISEWASKEKFEEHKHDTNFRGMNSVFPEYIEDWNFLSRKGKWIKCAYDLLRHNAETPKEKEFAIGYHTDNKPSSNIMPGQHQIITVTIYLNDNYDGGEVSFLNEHGAEIITYKPKAGDVTVFPSYKPFFHAAEPVSGEYKYFIRYFLTIMYDGSDEWKEGNEKFGPDVWRQMQQYRIMAEDRSGIHMKNVVYPAKNPNENFLQWSEIYKKQLGTIAVPFFAEKTTYIDGKNL
jgi:2OG-Fe(II) oxygenase superfamily